MEKEEQIKREIDENSPRIQDLLEKMNKVILDKENLIRNLATGVLAGGHVLLEGLPGLGKTELVKGMARLCRIQFNRVQFTPDLLPSDITGSFILEQEDGKREFVFRKGPVFTNILLGDEINRASPKTQSAMLEAMQERNVTVMGERFPLPNPFFVIATQNPIELEGTYPLPEAQVDRFLLKLHLDRPSEKILSDIVRDRINGEPPKQEPVMSLEDLRGAIDLSRKIYISEAVAAYISRLVEASHPDSPLAPESVKKYVRYGGSPRAAIALGASSRARSLIEGRIQTGFDTVRELYHAVMNHRIILDYSARIDGVGIDSIISDIVNHVDEYSKSIPSGVKK